MALHNGFPAVSGAATQFNIRRDLAGLVARNVSGTIRAGILPRHHNPLLVQRADMKLDILTFEAVLDRNGAVFVANEGTAQLAIAAAPSANSRIDVVYVKQMESASPLSDASDGPVFGVLTGTAAASPVKPTGLPAGALELGTLLVPAGIAGTNAAGVVLTQTYLYTAASGGAVTVRNVTELAAWAPADGASVYVISDNSVYVRRSGAWTAGLASGLVTGASGVVVSPGTRVWRTSDGIVHGYIDITRTAGALISGAVAATIATGFRPVGTIAVAGAVSEGGAAAACFVQVRPDGGVVPHNLAAGNQRLSLAFELVGS